MSAPRASLPDAYFESLYARDPDPWRFATSEYERRKYDATMAALGDRRFRSGFEVGCSIGVLTRRIAGQCDALLAVDVSETALAAARRRNAGDPRVRIARRRVPDEWPPGRFDLILLSEVLYYLAPADIERTAACAAAALAGDGVVLLVHWTGATNYPCSGDEAAARFIAAAADRLMLSRQVRAPEYRLDLLEPRPVPTRP